MLRSIVLRLLPDGGRNAEHRISIRGVARPDAESLRRSRPSVVRSDCGRRAVPYSPQGAAQPGPPCRGCRCLRAMGRCRPSPPAPHAFAAVWSPPIPAPLSAARKCGCRPRSCASIEAPPQTPTGATSFQTFQPDGITCLSRAVGLCRSPLASSVRSSRDAHSISRRRNKPTKSTSHSHAAESSRGVSLTSLASRWPEFAFKLCDINICQTDGGSSRPLAAVGSSAAR